jgi:hypothetical protein
MHTGVRLFNIECSSKSLSCSIKKLSICVANATADYFFHAGGTSNGGNREYHHGRSARLPSLAATAFPFRFIFRLLCLLDPNV